MHSALNHGVRSESVESAPTKSVAIESCATTIHAQDLVEVMMGLLKLEPVMCVVIDVRCAVVACLFDSICLALMRMCRSVNACQLG